MDPTLRRALLSRALMMVTLAVPASFVQAGWSNPQNTGYSYEQFSGWQTLAVDSNGYVHVAWKNWDNGPTQLRYATNRNGYWEGSVIPWGGGLSDGAGLCMVITPDDVLHLFLDGGDPTHTYEYTKPAAGTTWSGPSQVTGAEGGNFGSAAVDASGGIYAIWVKILFDPNRGTLYGRYKPFGGSWGAIETIRYSGNGWPSYNYVRGAGNKFYIGYHTSDTKPWLKIRDNGTLGPERTLASIGFAPKAVPNPNNENELVAVYHIDWRVWITFSSDGGASWTTPWNFSPYSAGPPQLEGPADVAWTPDGYVHVIWKRQDNGSRVYYRNRSPGGTWSSTEHLTTFSTGNSGLSQETFFEVGNDLHIVMSADCFPSDFLETVYMVRSSPTKPDVTGTLPITGLDVTPGNGKVDFEWTHPADLQLGAVTIRWRADTYPTGPTDGTLAGTITGSGAQDRTFTHYTTNGVTHYYAMFPYDAYGNYGPASYTLQTPWMRSDFDKDGDIDLADFAHIQECLTGSAVEQTDPDCLDCLLDYDGSPNGDRDVDADDLDIVLNCLSGEDVYAPPSCDPG